jgi:hypothetical protein
MQQEADHLRGGKGNMKKLIFFAVIGVLLSGCAMTSDEWDDLWANDNTYKNWEHMKFSWSGYENPSKETGSRGVITPRTECTAKKVSVKMEDPATVKGAGFSFILQASVETVQRYLVAIPPSKSYYSAMFCPSNQFSRYL